MTELQEQLAALRRRMARTLEECAEKYEKPRLPGFRRIPDLFESTPEADHSFHVEEWLPGEEVETSLGKHYETETFYARHRRHGSADIGALADMPANLLETLSDGAVRGIPPSECRAF